MLTKAIANTQFSSEDDRVISTLKFQMEAHETNSYAVRTLTLASLVQAGKMDEASEFWKSTHGSISRILEGNLDDYDNIFEKASELVNIEITDPTDDTDEVRTGGNSAKAAEDFEQKIDNYNYQYSYNDTIIRIILANLEDIPEYPYKDVDFSKVTGSPPPNFYETTYTKRTEDGQVLVYDRGMLVGTNIGMLKAAIKMIDNPQDRLQCFATIEGIARCIWKWNYVKITSALKTRITNDFQITQDDIRREISKYNRTSNPNKIMRLLMHFKKLGIPFNVKMFKIPTTEMSFVMNSSILSSVCPDIMNELEAF